MTPETVSNRKGDGGNLPDSALNNIDFEIRGQLDSTAIQMDQPLTGESKDTHLVFYQSNDEVRTPSQFHFKVFPINVRNPMEKKFLKSNQPFLSYLPSSTGHSAKVGRMAGAA